MMDRREFLRWMGTTAVVAGVGGPFAVRATRARGADGVPPVKVLCLGLDGMDPILLQQGLDEGALPNFARVLISGGHFSSCGTTVPPQSPVAWSSFITGQDPGGHGIVDFIHRDPTSLVPHLSLSEAKLPDRFWKLGDWRLPRGGGGVSLLRRGRAFWEDLDTAGVDVTLFKLPSNFPPVPGNTRSISGMGTPDILGTYGIFTYFTDDPLVDLNVGGGRVVPVRSDVGTFQGKITGPPNAYRAERSETAATFRCVVDRPADAVLLDVAGRQILLQEGEWSDWVRLEFEMVPYLKTVHGICRFHLMEVSPRLRLYVTPVQIDPADPEMPICTPDRYARDVAATSGGGFFTQGLPDDTKALDEGIFTDADYVSQADLVLAERMLHFRAELARFRKLDRGFLFFYFNSLDQNSHMFWRSMDPQSPVHAAADPRFSDRVRAMYVAMDRALGLALDACDERTILFAVSDHGFAPYRRSFHVNRWLLEEGYLALKPGIAPRDVEFLQGVDWRRTRAYALGINSLYLNLRGREKHGVVHPGTDREALLTELVGRLESAVDPTTGVQPVKHAYRTDQVFEGPGGDEMCDMVLGYRRGWRGSNDSALGGLKESVYEDNLLRWSGDHCMAADEVPGILVCNRPLAANNPSLVDLGPTFLRLFGREAYPEMIGRPLLG